MIGVSVTEGPEKILDIGKEDRVMVVVERAFEYTQCDRHGIWFARYRYQQTRWSWPIGHVKVVFFFFYHRTRVKNDMTYNSPSSLFTHLPTHTLKKKHSHTTHTDGRRE